jgi:hypothetical protein
MASLELGFEWPSGTWFRVAQRFSAAIVGLFSVAALAADAGPAPAKHSFSGLLETL